MNYHDRFNGCRLYISGDPNVWLVYHGFRHRICSPEIYNALFSEITGLIEYPQLFEIQEGYHLGLGTCLVKADGNLDRFLVVRTPDGIRRLHIFDWHTWQTMSFSENSMRIVPDIILETVLIGDTIAVTEL